MTDKTSWTPLLWLFLATVFPGIRQALRAKDGNPKLTPNRVLKTSGPFSLPPPPPPVSSLKNQSSKGQLPPWPWTVLREWSPTAIFKKFRCLLDIFSLFFFVCVYFLADGRISFVLLFPRCSSTSFSFFFFNWSRNAGCHSSRVSEKGVCVCAVGGRKVPGADQFFTNSLRVPKVHPRGGVLDPVDCRSLALFWVSEAASWSRCCVSAQPRVERSQLMIQLNKTWKRAERHESREGSTFRCCQAQILTLVGSHGANSHVSGVASL